MADKNIFDVVGSGLDDLGTQLFDPERWGTRQAEQDIKASGVGPNNARLQAQNAALQPILRAGAAAAPRANPYSTAIANQSRPAQLALLQQMQAQQAGPSLAAMQGARAQGANLQAALGAGGGRSVMSQAGQVGAGLSASTAQARLAEMLRGSIGLGNTATGMRGADLDVAGAQSQAGLQQRGLDDAMRQFYATQGASLSDATRNADLEYYKLMQRLQQRNAAAARQTGKDTAQTAGTVLDIIF